MSGTDLRELSVDELVESFAAFALGQYEADLDDDIPEFTRLFWQMEAVEEELKSRAPDRRRALTLLYDHPNVQVRLGAAKATLAVAPDDARKLIEAIAKSGEFPQAGDAGMTLDALDRGIFKPT